MPVIRDEVTTFCGPGELIDVIVTERGIAINPLRPDLIEKMKGSSLPIKTIHELKAEAEKILRQTSKSTPYRRGCAFTKRINGTVIDSVFRVDK